MNKQFTIENIEDVITSLRMSIYQFEYIGSQSDYVFQSQFDQFVTSTEETIRSLEKIKESYNHDSKNNPYSLQYEAEYYGDE